MRNKLLFTIFLGFASIFVPSLVFGQASLFISPSTGDYRVGGTFSVLVNVNSGTKSINAGSAQINFDHTKLSVVSLGYSQSVFTLWPQQPSFDNSAGTINFTGGVPSPGFNGAEGALLRITFKAKALGSASVIFVSGSVLANDGVGTNIADSMRGAVYRIQEALTPAPPKPVPTTPTPKPVEVAPEPPPPTPPLPPEFTNWPKTLSSGEILIIEGKATSSSKILLSISKNGDAPTSDETYTWPNGKFVYVMKQSPEIGRYQITAIVEASNGLKSDPSSSISIEVEAPTTICFGKTCFEKSAVIRFIIYFIFFLILLLLLLLIIILWMKTRVLEKNQKDEIRKLGGVESELSGMIEDLHRLENNEQGHKGEVDAEISRLTLLKEDVMRQISDLKKSGATTPVAQPKFVLQQSPVTPPAREEKAYAEPVTLASPIRPVFVPPPAIPVEAIRVAPIKREITPDVNGTQTPPIVEDHGEEIPVLNPFDNFPLPPQRISQSGVKESAPVTPIPKAVTPNSVSAPTSAPLKIEMPPSQASVAYGSPVANPVPAFVPSVKGTPFTSEEIGISGSNPAKPQITQSTPANPAYVTPPVYYAVPGNVTSPQSIPPEQVSSVPKMSFDTAPGRQLFTTPTIQQGTPPRIAPLKTEGVPPAERPSWPSSVQPQKWPPREDFTEPEEGPRYS